MQADHLLSVAGAPEQAGRARTRASPNTHRDHACRRTRVLTQGPPGGGGGELPLKLQQPPVLVFFGFNSCVCQIWRRRMPTRFMLAVNTRAVSRQLERE